MHQNAPFWGNFPKISRGWPPPPPSPFRRFAPQWSLRLKTCLCSSSFQLCSRIKKVGHPCHIKRKHPTVQLCRMPVVSGIYEKLAMAQSSIEGSPNRFSPCQSSEKQCFVGPFIYDVIIWWWKFASRCYVGHLAIRQLSSSRDTFNTLMLHAWLLVGT